MFWNKKKKVVKKENSNIKIVDNLIKEQNKYPISEDLTNIVAEYLKTGIESIKETEYEISFHFRNWFTYTSWNANKDYAWLTSRNKIKTPEWKIIKYGDGLRVSDEVMKQLMLATFDDYKKQLNYKLPKKIEQALALSNKAERLTYEISYMQTIIKDKLEEIQQDKETFKEKYWADIITILSKIKKW